MCVSVCRRVGGLAATAVLGALAVAAVAVPSAQASPTGPGVCDSSPLSRPFLAWGDPADYKLAPGGDFEHAAAGWSLAGAARVVRGSEPAGVTGTVGSSSLGLPRGGSAQSPVTCVTSVYPRLRFFARSDTPNSTLQVSVVYPTILGTTAIPVGVVVPRQSWTPTAAMPTLSAIAVVAGGTAPIGLRFTQLTGSSQVDDVFVDPHTMH